MVLDCGTSGEDVKKEQECTGESKLYDAKGGWVRMWCFPVNSESKYWCGDG